MKKMLLGKCCSSIVLLMLGFVCFSASGQRYKASDKMDRISIQMGGEFNYTMWSGLHKDFKSQGISPQIAGVLGYRFRDYNCSDKVAAVFVNYGKVAGVMTDRTVDFNRLDLDHKKGASGRSLEAQVGLISNNLRFSGGFGSQQIDLKNGTTDQCDYYVITLGGSPSYRNVKVIMGLSMLFGQDVRKITFRPSLGIAYRLDFLKSSVRRSSYRHSNYYRSKDS